jgi:8-oxo-dGTP pyrophosphatase MutT (NUDIX family)
MTVNVDLQMRSKKRFDLNVSVFVVVARGAEVLLVRRFNTGWKDGFYSLPAGAHDGGETLAQAASRELREETGLSADPATLQLVHMIHCRQGDTGGEWLGAFFLADAWSGTPSIQEPDKHDDLAWFDVNQLPENVIPYTRQGLLLSRDNVPFSTHGWD